MPLPWKKSKVSRISRIMADLQPQKPRNSMVVETGFPTSIVDLFVKNCDRLKKPTKKKNNKKNQNQPPLLSRVVEELLISDLSPSTDSLISTKFKRQDNSLKRFEILVGEIPNQDSDECLEAFKLNREKRGVFCRVFMVFLAVILALSTKKLAIGITISALLLLFLECIGKHFLQPCSSVSFFSLVRGLWVSNSVQIKTHSWVPNEQKKELIIVEEEKEHEDDDMLNPSDEEIQVDEARLDAVAREDTLSYGKRWGNLDMESVEYESEHIIHEKGQTHTSKIRRKIIKKLVPKKLRALKKARKGKEREEDLNSEASSHCGEGKICSSEESVEQYNVGGKWKLALLHLVEEEIENEEISRISDSSIEEAIVCEKANKEEDVGIKKQGNRGSLFLFLIVLAGLIGARFLALGLTVISCLIILVWREQRVFVNKNPASMSS